MKRKLQPHLMVGEGDVEPICFLSGDPNRVLQIVSYLKDAEEVARHRGLITCRGYTNNGLRVTITTTGMGSPSCAIVLEELRRVGAKRFIRVGSCGGLPVEVKTGDIVIPIAAVRDEATSLTYAPNNFPAVASPEIVSILIDECRQRAFRYHTGIVWTTDVFYPFSDPDVFRHWLNRRVLAIEMESSVLFTFAQVYGLAAGAILACDANLQVDPKGELETEETETGEFHPALKEAITKEIEVVLTVADRLESSSD